ncbi:hypothetical protein Paes_0965 [Prosthecochloris aestuarii DSM 271]|uniref:Uncharacterized protein n=1 Tax=Prosthecochloris aestuarii (strain DSM 271 / SK 413) TaxID=290512 RepID=B4S7H0_PROA2|nr:hypothetical protein [Prosthecochloris aestuarii]ACF46007.1 hypothetical protein Paes_0965 [Prosthecochloris aestuarii DSM 271]
MGLFSKLGDNGVAQSIECKTCGSTYRGNVDRVFPYAICGGCLEGEGNNAKRNGDKFHLPTSANGVSPQKKQLVLTEKA